jgi:CBS domain-containing protein
MFSGDALARDGVAREREVRERQLRAQLDAPVSPVLARSLRPAEYMARTVTEIMNRELLAIRPDLHVRDARELLRSFAVGAAPVLDDARHPIGFVSLRDSLEGERRVSDVMSRPAECVDESESIDHAARRLARGDTHHLIVVDCEGSAVGMLSTLDVLRALLGLPTRHPSTFPHWDETTGVSWTDDWPLEEESFTQAPDGPGVVTLVTGHAGDVDVIVWAEACTNVRARVRELASLPAQQEPALARVLALRDLRFRAALVREESARSRIVATLRDRLEHLPPPGST